MRCFFSLGLVVLSLFCLTRIQAQNVRVILLPFSDSFVTSHSSGFSIDVFEQAISLMNSSYGYNIRPSYYYTYSVSDFNQALREFGDIGIEGISVTKSQESIFQSSISYRTSVLRAFTTVDDKQTTAFQEIWIIFKNPKFLQYLLLLIIFCIPAASLIWLFEHKKNPETYHRNYLMGVGAGYYWSWITLSTVGYGDKAPKTMAGQSFTIFFIIVGIVLVNLLTGAISAIITVNSLTTPPSTLLDLGNTNVTAFKGSNSAAISRSVDANVILVASYDEGLQALISGEVSTFVCEQASLLTTNITNSKFILVGPSLADVEYRFLYSHNSLLPSSFISDMNFVISEFMSSSNYTQLYQVYFTNIFNFPQPHSTNLNDWIAVIIFLGVSVAYLIIMSIIFFIKRKSLPPENAPNQDAPNECQEDQNPNPNNEDLTLLSSISISGSFSAVFEFISSPFNIRPENSGVSRS